MEQRYPYLETLLYEFTKDGTSRHIMEMLIKNEIPEIDHIPRKFQIIVEELLDYIDQSRRKYKSNCKSIIAILKDFFEGKVIYMPNILDEVAYKINLILRKHNTNIYYMSEAFLITLFASYCKDMEFIQKRRDRERILALWRKYPEFSRLPEDILEYEIYPYLF